MRIQWSTAVEVKVKGGGLVSCVFDKDWRDPMEGELKSRRGCKTCDRLQLAKQDMNAAGNRKISFLFSCCSI